MDKQQLRQITGLVRCRLLLTVPEFEAYVASGALAKEKTFFVRLILRPGEDAWLHNLPPYLDCFRANRSLRLEQLKVEISLNEEVAADKLARGWLDTGPFLPQPEHVERLSVWSFPALRTLIIEVKGVGLETRWKNFEVMQRQEQSSVGRKVLSFLGLRR